MPATDTLLKIAAVLDLPLDLILGIERNDPSRQSSAVDSAPLGGADVTALEDRIEQLEAKLTVSELALRRVAALAEELIVLAGNRAEGAPVARRQSTRGRRHRTPD
jgi:hypothetical protein